MTKGIFIVEAKTIPGYFRMGHSKHLEGIRDNLVDYYGPDITIHRVENAKSAELERFKKGRVGESKLYPRHMLHGVMTHFGLLSGPRQQIKLIKRGRILIGDILEYRSDLTSRIGFRICDEYMQDWISVSPEKRNGQSVMVFWLDARTYKIEVRPGGNIRVSHNRSPITIHSEVQRGSHTLKYDFNMFGATITHDEFVVKFGVSPHVALQIELPSSEEVFKIYMNGGVSIK